MILVRNRTGFVELMVRSLKRRGIPVAGIDRMQLPGADEKLEILHTIIDTLTDAG
mgnify:CR=1 FL=1